MITGDTQRLELLVRSKCEEFGVEFFFPDESSVQYTGGIPCNGFFDNDGKRLAVARGSANWALTLGHEFSHMMQCQEGCKEWVEYMACDEGSFDPLLDPTIPKDVRQRVALITFNLELDCEKRTVTLLRELGFDGLEDYIQKANAYTLFYLFIGENCKWYKIGREPYQLDTVWPLFPRTFDFNREEEYERLRHLFWQCVE